MSASDETREHLITLEKSVLKSLRKFQKNSQSIVAGLQQRISAFERAAVEPGGGTRATESGSSGDELERTCQEVHKLRGRLLAKTKLCRAYEKSVRILKEKRAQDKQRLAVWHRKFKELTGRDPGEMTKEPQHRTLLGSSLANSRRDSLSSKVYLLRPDASPQVAATESAQPEVTPQHNSVIAILSSSFTFASSSQENPQPPSPPHAPTSPQRSSSTASCLCQVHYCLHREKNPDPQQSPYLDREEDIVVITENLEMGKVVVKSPSKAHHQYQTLQDVEEDTIQGSKRTTSTRADSFGDEKEEKEVVLQPESKRQKRETSYPFSVSGSSSDEECKAAAREFSTPEDKSGKGIRRAGFDSVDFLLTPQTTAKKRSARIESEDDIDIWVSTHKHDVLQINLESDDEDVCDDPVDEISDDVQLSSAKYPAPDFDKLTNSQLREYLNNRIWYPEDFVINPAFNEDVDFEYHEVLRGLKKNCQLGTDCRQCRMVSYHQVSPPNSLTPFF